MGKEKLYSFIVLVGPKHSGKSSVGRALAQLWGCDFIDLDEKITQRTGKTPRALYEEGREVFLEAEQQAAAELVTQATSRPGPKPLIVAAGGGLIDNPGALEVLKSRALLVSLEVDAATAWERIRRNAQGSLSLPPFLRTEDPEKTHRLLHERRTLGYKKVANYTISTEHKSPTLIAEELDRVLSMIKHNFS